MSQNQQFAQLKTGENVTLLWIKPAEVQWPKYRDIFIAAFSKQFKDFPLADLSPKPTDRAQLFAEWFDEEERYEQGWIDRLTQSDYPGQAGPPSQSANAERHYFFLEASFENQAIAYAIWHINPDGILYESSLAILPQWQRKNLGVQMTLAIREKLPTYKSYVLNTRKSPLNSANQFYRDSLKCVPTEVYPDETLEEPEKFTGYLCPL